MKEINNGVIYDRIWRVESGSGSTGCIDCTLSTVRDAHPSSSSTPSAVRFFSRNGRGHRLYYNWRRIVWRRKSHKKNAPKYAISKNKFYTYLPPLLMKSIIFFCQCVSVFVYGINNKINRQSRVDQCFRWWWCYNARLHVSGRVGTVQRIKEPHSHRPAYNSPSPSIIEKKKPRHMLIHIFTVKIWRYTATRFPRPRKIKLLAYDYFGQSLWKRRIHRKCILLCLKSCLNIVCEIVVQDSAKHGER